MTDYELAHEQESAGLPTTLPGKIVPIAIGETRLLIIENEKFALKLSVLPGQAEKSARLVIALEAAQDTHSTLSTRIILRNEKRQILASEALPSAASVNFSNLALGRYQLEARQDNQSWQWTLDLVASDKPEHEARTTTKDSGPKSRGDPNLHSTALETNPLGETKRMRRHTHLHFPSECQLGVSTPLSVQLTLNPLRSDDPAIRPPSPLDLHPSQQETQRGALDLLITVSARGFSVTPTHGTMNVPFDSDSELLTFGLTSLEPGDQLIEVRFFHQTARVGYVGLQTTVVP